MKLRPYQKAACDAVMEWVRSSVDPCVVDAAPAAGKSFMIASLSDRLHQVSGGKRVLVLAPSKELVEQDYEKFLLTGHKASIFSASAGRKSTRHHVVFGTPLTVKNAISRFITDYCAVIVDEAHGMTPTIIEIINEMRVGNPILRVIGLTGTPYRLGSGYIFRIWPDGHANGDDVTRVPYFTKCVYRVSAREMLDEGFITPMRIGAINSAEGGYDTSGVIVKANGMLDERTVEQAFVGHGRKTAAIVADVIEQARYRHGGIMYFGATVQHAKEILASLPPETSALVTGDTKKPERERIIRRYRAKEIRHLVNVGTLTTGFDVSHTETIALLRYTESAALLQQIMGRAWRLDPEKQDSLLLDYASNVERHFPDGDIYNPTIKAGKIGGGNGSVEAHCPDCDHINLFSLNPDNADYVPDKHGYALDVFGEPIQTEFGPLPVHYGRRCFGMVKTADMGKYIRCNYRWTGKDCPHCGEKNDIAARYCYECKGEIVDPNEKLAADFKALKKDPTQPQCDKVISMTTRSGVSAKGNATLRADFKTPYRQFSVWFMPESPMKAKKAEYEAFCAATADGEEQPDTITYVKDASSSFYRILAYNRPEDALE